MHQAGVTRIRPASEYRVFVRKTGFFIGKAHAPDYDRALALAVHLGFWRSFIARIRGL